MIANRRNRRQVRIRRLSVRSLASDRTGLTLLELMVVLVILAIVATVAMRSLEPQVNAQRYQSAARLLDEIQLATLGPQQKFQLDGTPLVSGFVADIGRLPTSSQVTPSGQVNDGGSLPSDGGVVLDELWDVNHALAVQFPFQFRPGPKQPADFSDIRLPCGWRGPYLNLAAGTRSLIDPWGRPPQAVATANGEVEEVRIELPESTGMDQQQSLTTSFRRGKVAVTGNVLLDQDNSGAITVTLLTPNPEASLTTLVAIADEDQQPDTFLFPEVPVGLRAIVVDANGQRKVKYVQVPHEGLNVIFDLRTSLN